MKVAGVCSLCSRATRSLNTCWRCGAIVCNEHFDSSTGLCIRCSSQARRKPLEGIK